VNPKDRLNEGIAAARSLISDGDLKGAEAVIAGLTENADIRAVGPITALGLPRRLHSALLHLAKARSDATARAGYQFHLVPPPDILEPLFRYTNTERRLINAANMQPVPRRIHQIWIGTLPVPAAAKAWQNHASAQGYDYRLWREADLDTLGITDNPVFATMRAQGDLPGTVDVARYAILAGEGGIYLDCDWYPARDDIGFHDLLPLVGMTAMAEDIPRLTGQGGLLLANSFIATPAGHPALHRLNAALPQALAALPKAPAWWSTGPLVFTLAARGGAVSLAPYSLVAGNLSRGAPFGDVEALQTGAVTSEGGLLIAWKSW
jgi:inositol phosphorylceramide mannosyltransferase catalytic subunit